MFARSKSGSKTSSKNKLAVGLLIGAILSGSALATGASAPNASSTSNANYRLTPR